MFIELRIIADLQVNPSWSRIFSRKRILPTEQCHTWISRLSSSMRTWWHWVSRETQLPWRSTTFWLRLVQLLLCTGIWLFLFLFIVTEYKRMQKNMGFFRQKITQTLILATRFSCIFLLQEISLRPENMKFFALFEIFDQNFERKIQPNEFPHSLYMSNYSTAAPSCIR